MKQGYFITGTDTNVGKTWATIALMRYFRQKGKSVAGMKPVASGCIIDNGVLKNEDALLIQDNSSCQIDYRIINPYAYAPPVSPHIAGINNPVITANVIARFDELKKMADIIIVEGAGGWYAPINHQQDIADLANLMALPVILIVAIRLGCINHAKLSYQAIQHSGLPCAGWIAMCVDPEMLNRNENIQTLQASLAAPLLGIMPYREKADFNFFAEQLDGSQLC